MALIGIVSPAVCGCQTILTAGCGQCQIFNIHWYSTVYCDVFAVQSCSYSCPEPNLPWYWRRWHKSIDSILAQMMTAVTYEQWLNLKYIMCSKVNVQWMIVARELATSNAEISSHFDGCYDTAIQRWSRKDNRKQGLFLKWCYWNGHWYINGVIAIILVLHC